MSGFRGHQPERTFSLMEVHEAAELFPIDDESIGELADDIKKNGQQVPVEICGGKVIDGRRRIKACQIAGVEPITREVSPADPVAYVLSINLHRRHLTESQRAMIGARVKGIYEKEAKERQKMAGQQYHKGSAKVRDHGPEPSDDDKPEAENGGDQKPETPEYRSRDAAGATVSVSGREVDRATAIMKRGIPELIEAVQKGRISVRFGEQIAKEEKDVQREIVAAENPGKALRLSKEVAKGVKAGTESTKAKEEDSKPKKRTREPVGVLESQNAINCLCRIPKDDPLWEAGLRSVATWIRQNLPRKSSNGKA